MRGYILGIDPGNKESAFCLVSPDFHPVSFAKLPNMSSPIENRDLFFEEVKKQILSIPEETQISVVIEGIESYGMPVGREVFDTARYIGRLEALIENEFMICPATIYRHDEKRTICHSAKANDATIKQALIDRFAPGVRNHGKGTKKEPGWFYGMKADCWSAYAIAITYADMTGMSEEDDMTDKRRE